MYRYTPALVVALLVGCSQGTPTPSPSASPASDEQTSREVTPTEPADIAETSPVTTPAAETPAANPEIVAFLEGDEQLRARLEPVIANPTLPPFSLTDWHNSEPVDDWTQLEGKLVLIDFWATWCGPCIASIPHTNELAERYAGEVVVIGVCAPSGADKLEETIADRSIHYPVAVDDGSAWNGHFEVNGFPDYYLIGRNGELLAADIANSQVDAAIAYFLSN